MEELVKREAIMSHCSARTTDKHVIDEARKETQEVSDIRDLIDNMVEIRE